MSEERKKIAIAIHGMDFVGFRPYVNHLGMIAHASQNFELSLISVCGTRITQARNAIVDKIEEMGCEYLFFLDTDHIVPDNCLDLLMQSMKVASCVSGLICRRRDTMDQIGFLKKEDAFVKISMESGKGVYSVDICAFGCTLIDVRVFKELESPVFKNETRIKKDGKSFELRSDSLFCEQLKAIGKTIMIDSRVVVGHIGESIVVWPDNCKELKKLVDKKKLGF